jgi:hypothetical protein
MNRFPIFFILFIASANIFASGRLKETIELCQKTQKKVNCALTRCTAPRCAAFTEELKPVKNSEIKISIPCDDKNKITNLKLDEERQIHFLDSKDLELNKVGALVREREGEMTIKLRPMDPNVVDEEWYSFEDFKCEDDAILVVKKENQTISKKSVISCSLTVNANSLSEDQKRFLKKFKDVDYDKVEKLKLGPIKSSKYKYKTIVEGLAKVDLEEWILGPLRNSDGTIKKPAVCFLEISSKVALEESEKALKLMYEHFKALGLEIDNTPQGNKSKKALEYFSQN